MQLAEFDATGETGNDSDGDGIPYLPEQIDQLAPVFATEATYNLQVTGINDNPNWNESAYKFYPNPASSQIILNFDLEKEAQLTIQIFDLVGKNVQSISAQQTQAGKITQYIDLSNIKPGIYFLRLSLDDKPLEAQKLIIH